MNEPTTRSGAETTLALSVYNRIRADVLAGTLEPGTRLAMAKLRERYSVGLSPLREALSRLVGEGLVVAEGQRGFRVLSFSAADLEDLLFVWQMVEEGALRVAMARRDEQWEAGVVAAFHVLERRSAHGSSEDAADRDSFEDAERTFSLALTAGANLTRVATIQRVLYDQARRYRLVFREEMAPAKVVENYRSILQCVLAYQADDAVEQLRQRVAAWRDALMRLAGW